MRPLVLAVLTSLALSACQASDADPVATDQPPSNEPAAPSSAASGAPAVAPTAAGLGTPQEKVVAGQVILKTRTLAHAQALHRGGRAALRALGTTSARALADVLTRYGIAVGHQIVPNADVEHLRRLVTLRGATNVDAAIRDLRALPDTEYAEPNRIATALYTPNDPYFSSSGSWGQPYADLWGLGKIQASTAWNTTLGTGAVVAIVDSGIDYTHPDIAANIWTNPGETGLDAEGRDKRFNGIDDDGNGLIDDWEGYNFVNSDTTPGTNNPMDDFGHGTHVAGTVGAVANNGIGIVGVAPSSRVMAIKALASDGSGATDDLVRAVYYAANEGAHVINASWGGYSSGVTQAMSDVVTYAHDTKGVAFVAAAGNSTADVGTPTTGYWPGNLRDSITVAATDHTDAVSFFSNFGLKIDVAAPGGGDSDPTGLISNPWDSILSLRSSEAEGLLTMGGALVVGTNYFRLYGTSMAAPHVSGVAALLHAKYPTFSPEQIRQALRVGADDIAAPGFDVQSGYGRVNAATSLTISAPLTVQLLATSTTLTGASTLAIQGTASGPGFASWVLDYEVSGLTNAWQPIASGTTAVVEATIGSWNLTGLVDNTYLVRLRGVTASGSTFQDLMQVVVVNNSITSPLNPSATEPAWHDGTPITLVGTVTPPALKSYAVAVTSSTTGPVASPNIVLANGGTQQVVNGTLATWNPAGLPAGRYTVVLTTTLQNGLSSAVSTTILVDPMLHAGWPVRYMAPPAANAVTTLRDHFVAADVDGDGTLEIPVISPTQVSLYHGNGQLVTGWPISVSANPTLMFGPAMGDLDGDGKAEVVLGTGNLTSGSNGFLYAFHGDGTEVTGFPVSTGGEPMQVTLADLNGDGHPEIIAPTDSALWVLSGTGTSLTGWPVTVSVGSRAAVGDLNQDGQIGIVIRSSTGQLHVFGVNGQEWSGFPVTLPDSAPYLTSPVLADVNGDGKLEIVVADSTGKLHALHGDGTYLSGWPKQIATVALNPPAIADLDGDGQLDIVLGTAGAQLFAVHSDGTAVAGWPASVTSTLTPFTFGVSAPSVADIDGDGTLEVIVTIASADPNNSSALMAFHSNGTPLAGFPRPTPSEGMAASEVAGVADLNNDGKLELIWGDSYGDLGAYDLTGPSTGAAPWPMANHDAAHSGAVPVPPPSAKYEVGSAIEAVAYDSQSGTQDENNNTDVGYFDAGDYLCYNSVDLDTVVALGATVASANSGGVISIRTDSPTGTEIGSYTFQSTGGWTTWDLVSIPLTATAGVHTLCIHGESGSGIGNFQSFVLTRYTVGSTIEAVAFDSQSGTQDENNNTDVGYFDAGDYLCYKGVDLDDVAVLGATVASANSGGVISIRTDSPTGTEIGSYTFQSTGSWTTWKLVPIPLTATSGVHTLCIHGESGAGIGNFQSFVLTGASTAKYQAGSTIEAVAFDSQSGTQDENNNTDVGYFDAGDYLCYNSVDLDAVVALGATVASANSGGVISIRTDSPTGAEIGSYTFQSTGSWTTWDLVSIPLTATAGVHTLCIHGESGSGIGNFQSFLLAR